MTTPGYAHVYGNFRWDDSLRALGWTAAGEVNLGTTILDRHVGRNRPALRWFQYPREIEFVDRLPKTETGKIQRFLLRGR